MIVTALKRKAPSLIVTRIISNKNWFRHESGHFIETGSYMRNIVIITLQVG